MTLPVPVPGTDIIPDGWAETTVVPWLVETTNESEIRDAAARIAAVETAYRLLDGDTLELTKARRYLEVRWGELLGPSEQGKRTDLEPTSNTRDGSCSDANEAQRRRLRKLAEGGKRVIDAIATATDSEQISRNELLRVAAGVHVRHNSGDNEWYTPANIVDAAREVMGGIDLDPCSSADANEVVQASSFFTEADDGLRKDWKGRVWMNPPYARPLIDDFCAKLAEHYSAGDVEQACVICNNATETGWFHALAEVAAAVCFPRHRVKYWQPGVKSLTPLQGQAVVYLGDNEEMFHKVFIGFGFTVTMWQPAE